MAKTKKVGSTGRLGSRYGRKIRVNLLKIEKQQKKKYECPSCKAEKVKRVASGIWGCRKCGHTFAGAAYTPFPKVAAVKEAISVEEFEAKNPTEEEK